MHEPRHDAFSSGETVRVVICGGGVIGACTAYFLSRRGVDVIVVERTGVAAAASGKAGAGPSGRRIRIGPRPRRPRHPHFRRAHARFHGN
jgi:glycine/D-amino acid oxidase-like deaminating enzyme